ncbi:MAG: SWIM zinc finger family protein [Acidobacteria bacterium]|nr:SWIM zinc finger family protein [Acidobacteriota bacterium]
MAARGRPRGRRPAHALPPYGWYPPPSRPLPAEGIRARSRRGDIGETWWSRRFIDILESFHMGSRLTRGRRYARAGQVLDLVVEPGAVTARVQGSRAKPYRVRIGTLTLSQKDWGRVEETMASKAVFLAKLLSGEMPRDIEEAFAETRLSLFPANARDLTTDCSCPDWANPCKHIAATYYLLAEAFDADPFLIFRWRGRDREELLARLRASPSGLSDEEHSEDLWDVPAPEVRPLAECIDRFWDAGEGIDHAPPRPRAAAVADGILRGLEPGTIEVRGHTLADVLAPAYAAITVAAERRALEDEPE